MRLKVYLPKQTGSEPYDLFCYSSHGLPGLEIVGLGSRARALKEKVIYLTKLAGHKVPLKRYVICLDRPLKKGEDEAYFELPIILLYWAMAGFVPIKRLTDCLCCGKVDARSQVLLPDLSDALAKGLFDDFAFIGLAAQLGREIPTRLMPVDELLPDFNYKILRQA